MTDDLVIKLGEETMKITAMVSAPLLISTLVIGLIVSVVQAITQINETTLTFIPKMIVVGIVIALAGPWMLDTLSQFTIGLIENISMYVRE